MRCDISLWLESTTDRGVLRNIGVSIDEPLPPNWPDFASTPSNKRFLWAQMLGTESFSMTELFDLLGGTPAVGHYVEVGVDVPFSGAWVIGLSVGGGALAPVGSGAAYQGHHIRFEFVLGPEGGPDFGCCWPTAHLQHRLWSGYFTWPGSTLPCPAGVLPECVEGSCYPFFDDWNACWDPYYGVSVLSPKPGVWFQPKVHSYYPHCNGGNVLDPVCNGVGLGWIQFLDGAGNPLTEKRVLAPWQKEMARDYISGCALIKGATRAVTCKEIFELFCLPMSNRSLQDLSLADYITVKVGHIENDAVSPDTFYNSGRILANKPNWTYKVDGGTSLCAYYNIGDDGASGIYGVNWLAQTVTLFSTVSSVRLKLFRVGSPGTVTVSLRGTDVNGHPTGPEFVIATLDGNSLTATGPGLWYEIPIRIPSPGLSGKLAIVVRAPSGNASNQVAWRCKSFSATYTGGNYEYSSDSGVTWGSSLGFDLMFEVWSDQVSATLFQPACSLPPTDSYAKILLDPPISYWRYISGGSNYPLIASKAVDISVGRVLQYWFPSIIADPASPAGSASYQYIRVLESLDMYLSGAVSPFAIGPGATFGAWDAFLYIIINQTMINQATAEFPQGYFTLEAGHFEVDLVGTGKMQPMKMVADQTFKLDLRDPTLPVLVGASITSLALSKTAAAISAVITSLALSKTAVAISAVITSLALSKTAVAISAVINSLALSKTAVAISATINSLALSKGVGPPPQQTASLTGTVSSFLGPVKNATVSLAANLSTATGDDGSFELDNIPVGSYTLTVTPTNLLDKLVLKGASMPIDLTLPTGYSEDVTLSLNILYIGIGGAALFTGIGVAAYETSKPKSYSYQS